MFKFDLTGDLAVSLRFEQFPQQLHQMLLARITKLTRELEGRVKSAAPNDSGKLRNEITARITDLPERITGSVGLPRGLRGTEYAKAGALEYGAHGSTVVKAYEAASGRMVKSYTRRLNIVEHRFLRGPLADMSEQVLAELNDAVDQAIAAVP